MIDGRAAAQGFFSALIWAFVFGLIVGGALGWAITYRVMH